MSIVTKKTVIIGAGGHSKVIFDILKSNKDLEIVGFVDSPITLQNNYRNDVCILGDDSILPRLFKEGVQNAFVAIGENKKRQELTEKLIKIGFELVNAISPHAHIAESVKLGKGIAVMPSVVINADSVIGNGAIVNTGATIDHDCELGEFCHIAPGSTVAGSVRIGKGTFLGVGTKVIDRVTIGDWTTIGAGGVIIKSIPSGYLAVGVPAILKKKLSIK